MSNPFGENFLNPQPQYGDVSRQTELLKEAPISGAPTPGAATPTQSSPAVPTPSSAGPAPIPEGPVAMPHPVTVANLEYYDRMAATWRALAKTPHASPMVREMAQQARQAQIAQHRIAEQVGY